MRKHGAAMDEVTLGSRRAMLDVLEALEEHRQSIVIVGAHAIYMQVQTTQTAVAPFTRDSDMVIDPEVLLDEPLLEAVLQRAGFTLRNPDHPGTWQRGGDELDLMVPSGAGGGGRRAARIPPHARNVARKTRGLEGALVDNDLWDVESLEPAQDSRKFKVKVAGPAALLVSKLYKLKERLEQGNPDRQQDKDAHDIYRILLETEPAELKTRYQNLLETDLSADVAKNALGYLHELFAAGETAEGSVMAGRAEEGIGNPTTVSLQASALAEELLGLLR